jgi:hypothetical protein
MIVFTINTNIWRIIGVFSIKKTTQNEYMPYLYLAFAVKSK